MPDRLPEIHLRRGKMRLVYLPSDTTPGGGVMPVNLPMELSMIPHGEAGYVIPLESSTAEGKPIRGRILHDLRTGQSTLTAPDLSVSSLTLFLPAKYRSVGLWEVAQLWAKRSCRDE